MRLISQDGMIDVPYDKCCLEVEASRREGSVVYFIYAHTNKMTLSLARYSSESKALKVMEMLREYKETKEIKSMLLTKTILESFTNTKIKNFEIRTDGIGDYFKVDIVKKVEYFQFPKDEEVEV